MSRIALAWRLAHAGIAATFLSAIALVWWSALTGRRGPLLRPAVAALLGEGALVAANGGDCPLGGLQQRVGDPVPLFELVLPPRVAHRAVPVLGAVTAAGLVVLAARQSDARLGFAYVMNNMNFYMFDDPREKPLRDAVHRSIRRLSG